PGQGLFLAYIFPFQLYQGVRSKTVAKAFPEKNSNPEIIISILVFICTPLPKPLADAVPV
ncbi:hypothetical protein, partial [Staphylococcus aureus]|uniref:hypothetical protein n=1 Tax=Staphylococcus aureus TaxID=1280 RepID=UPI00301BF7D6